MTNNLKKLKQELKSFAKRVKDFKYTDAALISFLLTGAIGIGGISINLFSAEDEIKVQTKAINTSIVQLKQDFRKARTENNKLLRNTNLELIQLMEQGDHVVKSPWSSWQYGINGFYNNWQGHYKGRGDKVADVKYERDKTMGKYKYNTTPDAHSLYGNTTDLGLKQEPVAIIPVSASLTPLVPKVKNANLSMDIDVSNLPNFIPRTVNAPKAPNVSAPSVNLNVELTLTARSRGSWQQLSAMNTNVNKGATGSTSGVNNFNGVFEGVTVTKGDITVTRNLGSNPNYQKLDYTVNNLTVKNTSPSIGNVHSTTALNGLTYGNALMVGNNSGIEDNVNGLFQISGNGGVPSAAFFLNNSKVTYVSSNDAAHTEELVHQDIHNGLQFSKVITEFSGLAALGLDLSESFKDILGMKIIEDGTAPHGGYNIFTNTGNIDISGKYATFSNSYSHDDLGRANGIILNQGKIIHNSVESAVFIVSPDTTHNYTQQFFYNEGKLSGTGARIGDITTKANKTAMFYFANDAYRGGYEFPHSIAGGFPIVSDRRIAVINKGKMTMEGDQSVGIYFNPRELTIPSNPTNISHSLVFTNFSKALSAGKGAPGAPVQGTATSLAGTDTTVTYVGDAFWNGSSRDKINKLDINVGTNAGDGGKWADTNMTDEAIIMKGNNSAGIYVPGTHNWINGAFGVELQNNGGKDGGGNSLGSAGIYSKSAIDLQAHYIHLNGSAASNGNGQNNVGVYTPGTGTANGVMVNLGIGRIKMTGGSNNTGIAVENGGSVHSESDMVLDGGTNNTAIFASGKNTTNTNAVNNWEATARSISTSNVTTDNIFIFADGGARVKTHENLGGLKIQSTISNNPLSGGSTPTTGAVYAKGGATVDISRGTTNSFTSSTDWNVDVAGKQVGKIVSGTWQPIDEYTGFGLYADGNVSGNPTKIIADNNKIKVIAGSTAVASTNGANVSLKGSTVHYEGAGYALYTDNGGTIDMSKNGTQASRLELGGKAVGYINDTHMPNSPVNLTDATIHVSSNDVIIADLRNSDPAAGGVVTLNINNSPLGSGSLQDQTLGTGITVTNDPSATQYKYASVDNGILNVNASLDRGLTTPAGNSDSEVFSKRLLYQNSIVNVASTGGVKANLNTAQVHDIDSSWNSPIGIALSASSKSTSNNTTQINNDGKIEVNRTDTGAGGVGLYVNYGKIHNKSNGTVAVEATNKNDNAVGIFGTNSTPITNDGAVTVGGKKSFGILGLSYRLDSKGNLVDHVSEPFATSAGDFGKIEITNNKIVTMNDDSAIGIYVLNNSSKASTVRGNNETWATNTATGTITMNGSNNAIGMAGSKATLTNAGVINVNGTKSAGMYANNSSVVTNANTGTINVVATSSGNESIGMFTDDVNTKLSTAGTINVGQSSYGVYGKNVDMTGGKIDVSDDAIGIYSTGPTVNLTGGKINIANNNAVGVYIADDNKVPVATMVNSNVDMKVGDTDSFGYLITASNAKTDLTTHAPNDVHIGEKSVYIYSGAPKALGGKIENYSNIVTDKNNGYGIYSSQDSINHGNINLMSGNGNIGIYSTQGTGKNYGTIEVGMSDVTTKQYGIGMATGYYDENTKAASNVGTVENYGTINVTKENSVGMYAVGRGAKAVNRGTINLDGKNTTGMYIDRYAEGENYGVIQTTPTANGTGIKGVVVTNGGVIKNYGTIKIMGSKNIGVYVFRGDETSSTYKPYEEHGTGNTSTRPYLEGTATDKKITGKAIVKVPPASLPSAVSISIDGVQVEPVKVDTNVASPQAPEVNITDLTGVTTLNLATEQMDHNHTHSNGEISSIGMYVDTSGINYTNPIQGLSNLYGLTDIDLIMGTEVTKYLNAKAIQIGDNILKPYNDALASVVSTGVTLNVNSSSLTWIAQPVESGNIAAPIKTVYMVKIPYTDFASKNDVDTEHFLDGLEQRYGVEGIHSREKQIFNKLNDLGKGENHIFAQAVNEMKGYEYSNTQQRINATGNTLDKEFKYLHDEWRNPSKQSNKIKVFGQKDEYRTDTAGVIDYDSNAYGVAYVHEDEAVTLGNSAGWYAGAVSNRFKFKDLGKSTEQQSMIRAGVFKTVSPVKDHNGNLRWTIAGDVFGGVNNMHRKFWVVDDTFYSKADYYTYGAALKTDLGYDIRLSERTHLRPYGALKMEYGRFTDINEDRGQMNLEVKGNDYFSVKPEVGAEFKYIQPLAVRTQLSIGLSAAYENEIGKLNRLNQARVRYTTADWYNLRNDKEDRHGNGKFDLNLGIDNTRFGVTVNAGYDTKGENVRGGLGFRLIY